MLTDNQIEQQAKKTIITITDLSLRAMVGDKSININPEPFEYLLESQAKISFKAGAEAQLAKFSETTNEELVKIITKMIAQENPNQIKYTLSPKELAYNILSQITPVYEAQKLQAVKEERERIIKSIESKSTRMNTNMYGISLSQEDWQALKGDSK